ncbi:MAG: 50S ribosomal protein L11 methyltransferase, partial [Rhodospirillales bacterium]
VPAAAVSPIEDVLARDCMAVSSFLDEGAGRAGGALRVEGVTGAEPDPKSLAKRLAKALGGLGLEAPAVEIEPLPPRDWVAENLKDFPPLRVGRYFIHGSHVPGPAPSGSVAIRLDAGTAFGSGEHPSTAGCLRALDRLARERRFRRPLDMGCGSGILALAMAKTWRVPVVASDIDDRAVGATALNARVNGVRPLVRTARGPGYRAPAVQRGGPYDLVCANILAGPLCRMAGDLDRCLARPGVAVLSGFLDRDGPRVVARHRPFGLSLVRAVTIDGWRTVVLAR